MNIKYEHWRQLNPSILWAYRKEVSQEQADEMEQADAVSHEISAWYVARGSARITQGSEVHLAKAGEWIFPPLGRRSQSFTGPLEILSITISANWPDGRSLFSSGFPRICPEASLNLLPVAEGIVEQIQAIHPWSSWYLGVDPISITQAAQLSTLAGQWLEHLGKALSTLGIDHTPYLAENPTIKNLQKTLTRIPLDEKLRVEHAAKILKVSRSHLSRLIAQHLDTTYSELSELRRIKAAPQILQQTQSIKETATQLGFNHLPNFTRWFQRHFNETPREHLKTFS